MSGKTRPARGQKLIPAVLFAAGALYWLEQAGPMVSGGEINIAASTAAALLMVCAMTALVEILSLLGNLFDWQQARTTQGLKGTAGFVRRLGEVRPDLIAKGWGPYWGVFKKGQPIFADYASNALTIGPAGSGKGIGVVTPMILSVHQSKTVVDFKGELACMLARALRQRGETVRILNLGDLFTEILGPTDYYNPICLILDDVERPGGLRDVSDDAHEMSLQLLPNSGKGDVRGENVYFDDGSRTFIAFCMILCVLLYGPEATLGDVAQMLNDRKNLLKHALWVCGRLTRPGEDGEAEPIPPMPIDESPWASLHPKDDLEAFTQYFRGVAAGIGDLLSNQESRTADSFLTGAQQALSRFNISTRAHLATSKSSFRFAEQKESNKPVTVFIVADAARINAQKPVLGLIQYCMMQELKRHQNKHRPVYLIADEATNFKLHDLGSLMTWGRGYGIRLHLIFQALSAFRAVYGQDVLNIALSEAEIVQILPGQREPDTLKLIAGRMGKQSIVTKQFRGQTVAGPFGVDGINYQETGRELQTEDEIRRSDKAILFLRRHRPLLTDLPLVAAIDPFRTQIDINPFHGKPFLLPIQLRLRRGRSWTFGF